MTEDTLLQKVTADYLLNDLRWNESIYGMEEALGKVNYMINKHPDKNRDR